MSYKYILFDADNTLFDFDKCEYEAFVQAVTSFGIEFSDDLYSDYHIINDRLWKMLELGGIKRDVLKTERYRILLEKCGRNDVSCKELAKKYELCLGNQCYEIDGVYKLLGDLSGEYKLYLITNGLTNVQESRLSLSRLTKYFTDVFISEKVGVAKPDPRFFDHVISSVGDGDLTKYLVVGDSLTSDIDGAIKYGIDCCWYNRTASDSAGRSPRYIIDDITKLKTVL
ncbi:MAG: YjjG family noncanonical pyrimidine nucleotidase [Clostridia bacterium]|nr:YjjG family noncanonical pyrimidine nucleotidase [Clostridia bacterium]